MPRGFVPAAQHFVARANLGYVVVDETRTPVHLVDFVIEAWRLEEIGRDGALTRYRPRTP